MRQLQGQTIATVPVVDSISPSTVGADLTKFRNETEPFLQDNPAQLALYVTLSGGTSVYLSVYVHDPDYGWSRASDTGNLGFLGGQALPSNDQYVFLTRNTGIFDQMVILQSTNVGAVSIGPVSLVEYVERLEDRKQ